MSAPDRGGGLSRIAIDNTFLDTDLNLRIAKVAMVSVIAAAA
jgi:hypothetical protein